ncbi:MAG: ferritin-like domain-containing protein [Solirubrobacterales bacterium]
MRPVINPVYPVAEITSVDQLMSIAVGMENEAARRYEQLAAAMERRGEGGMATLFRQLSQLERDHESGLARWAEREGRRRPDPAAFPWPMPETFGEEGDGTLTPYEALGIAVRNEERAFAFYSYLAAMAPEDETRERAEALAREELVHVRQLRMLRRRAFHMERRPPRALRRARDIPELQAVARGLEAGAAEACDALAAALVADKRTPMAVLVRQQGESARKRRGGGLSVGPGSAAVEAARAAGVLVPGGLTVPGALRLALRDAEEVLDAYLGTAEHATDAQLMTEAQALAEEAMARLAVIRSLAEEPEGKGLA